MRGACGPCKKSRKKSQMKALSFKRLCFKTRCSRGRQNMQYKYRESLFGATMLVVGLILFMHTYADQYQNLLTNNVENISPMFYARVIFGGWCLLALGMCVQSLLFQNNIAKPFNWRSVFVALSMIGLLVIAINFIGFIIAASLFFFSFAVYLGFKSKIIAAVAAVGISYGILLVFDKILGVILPVPIFSLGV